MFTLQLRKPKSDVIESETLHESVNDALREYEGWKDPTLEYSIEGVAPADYVCKRVLESRNRVLYMHLAVDAQPATVEDGPRTARIIAELKAPQICKLLQSAADNKEGLLIRLHVLSNAMYVG